MSEFQEHLPGADEVWFADCQFAGRPAEYGRATSELAEAINGYDPDVPDVADPDEPDYADFCRTIYLPQPLTRLRGHCDHDVEADRSLRSALLEGAGLLDAEDSRSYGDEYVDSSLYGKKFAFGGTVDFRWLIRPDGARLMVLYHRSLQNHDNRGNHAHLIRIMSPETGIQTMEDYCQWLDGQGVEEEAGAARDQILADLMMFGWRGDPHLVPTHRLRVVANELLGQWVSAGDPTARAHDPDDPLWDVR
ncbi:MAG TPA: hypothetical protein VLF40_01255 [Candidatus Saccharimonadales bacterium]|nr:hypothetical protein [Candidatus Saccharimonadales bacterium]